jgi:ribonuclease P protein component
MGESTALTTEASGGLGRITHGAVFATAFRQGRLAVSDHFELFAAIPEGQDSTVRLGLAISRKAAPTAVLRNLAKRISRESARATQQSLPARSYVLRGRPTLRAHWDHAKLRKTTRDFKQVLRTEIDGLFVKAIKRISQNNSQRRDA